MDIRFSFFPYIFCCGTFTMNMNTRWTELADKCWDARIDGWHFDQEMFAELIVRECIKVCPHEESRNHIRKNFGIENESNI